MGRKGMKIRAVDGFEESGHDNILSTPLYYHANPGDKLTLLDKNYKFNVATYRPEVEPRWMYTYDYAPEQSWTIYNNDLSGESYRQDAYIFNERVYFRVCLRKVNGKVFDGPEDINSIISFSTEPVPEKSKLWLDDEVRRVLEQVESHRAKEDMAFILMTDTHYTVNGTWDDTLNAVKQLNKGISLNGIIHLGDMTDGMVTRDATRHYVINLMDDLKSCGIPVWITIGNHDANYFQNNPEPFTDEQIKELYFGGSSEGSTGGDDVRYCVDLPGFRLVFLDSFDPNEKLRYGYSKECLMWLEEALKSTPENSKTLILSHLPPLTRLQFWTKELRGEKELAYILKNHEGKLIAWINGHNHADRPDNDDGYPIVSIANAKCEAFTEYKAAGFVTPHRELNTVTQEAFDIMLVNIEDGTIRFIRFGAGEDRLIKDGKAMWL